MVIMLDNPRQSLYTQYYRTVWWVDHSYNIHEDTLGLIQLPDTKAAMIFLAVLIRCYLSINQCRGQAFDGASNMSGIKNGAQALFKAEAKQELYVHYLAHSLSLCLKENLRSNEMSWLLFMSSCSCQDVP